MFSYVRWDEATLVAAGAVTPSEPGSKLDSPDDVLRRTIHVTTWTPSLTLLYFHTPHEDLEKSKLVGAAGASLRQCKTMHDEQVVRWLSLYHPVEVDMGKSDVKTAERLGMKDGAIMAVVDQDLHVLATSKPLTTSEAMATFLKTAIKSDACKNYWAAVQKQIDEQKAALEKARAFAKQEKWKEAAEQYKAVLDSSVRVGDFFDDVVREAGKALRKAAEVK